MEKAGIKVNVKWSKNTYAVDVDPATETVDSLKVKLMSLTGVPVDKQKVIFKGTTLSKDDAPLSEYKIGDNAALLMMGTAEENKAATLPTVQKKFIEELSASEKAQMFKELTGEALPIGLKNLGNTCYMNASVQCLRRINELKECLLALKKSRNSDPQEELAANLGGVFRNLESKGESVVPEQFLGTLFNLFPHFAERDASSHSFKQQDADECFQNILQVMSPYLTFTNPEGEKLNLIDYLFKIEFESTLKNTENPEEPPQVKTDQALKLPCIIDNQGNPVSQLAEGIQAGLEEKIEKHSSTLNRNAIYQKVSKIKKLPPYLLVQKVRFFWKEAVANAGTKATKTKILKNVSYPRVLDLFPFVTDELKKSLEHGREYEKKKNDELKKDIEDRFTAYKKKLEESGKMLPDDSRALYKTFKEETSKEDLKFHDEQLYRKHGFGLETGNYELVAVLTHKGRSADSGHYVAWVHKKGDEWIMYDDDDVSTKTTEDVLNLRGGGDWHMAYYLLYRKIEVG